ncbi:MAG: hypothetical protein ACOCTS_01975 [Thermodesulfobacteriota bacterium]
MVLTLMIPLRKIFYYERIITDTVLERVAQTIVFTGLNVGFSYGTEQFIAWYSQNSIEMETFRYRVFGAFALEFWIMVICNSVIPLLFFSGVSGAPYSGCLASRFSSISACGTSAS